MRVIFMGTPQFAVPSLKKILELGFSVPLVVTTPDRTQGRGLKQTPSDVKKFALEQGLQVCTPEKMKDENFKKIIESINPDLICVVAFKILPEAIFSIPTLGAFNLHGSLLPKYRGAAPINHALINGETETGVTTFFLKQNVDTGNIILQDKIQISDDMTATELHDEMMEVGAELVGRTLELITESINKNKAIATVLQNDLVATPAPKIFREDCKIIFDKSANQLHNFVRGLSYYPGAYMIHKEKILKILRTKRIENELLEIKIPNGELKHVGNKLFLGTKSEALQVLELQPEGKKIMQSIDFINGRFLE